MDVRTPHSRIVSVLPALVFSIALSVALVCGGKIVFRGNLRTVGFSVTHIEPFRSLDVLWVILLTALLTAAVVRVPRLYVWLQQRGLKSHVPADRKHATLLHLALTGGFAVAWLPMLLTYAPGGVNADALFSINQALYAGVRSAWNNHHPVLYAFFLRLPLAIGTHFHNMVLGVFIATLVQYVILAAVCGYSVVWLARKGMPVVVVVLVALFYSLFPIFPIFAVGLSKDTLFAALVLLYALHLADVIESDGRLLKSVTGIATFIVLSLLLIFCRNNGFLLVVGAGIALACVYRMRVKPIYPLLVGVLAFAAIVQGPVYDRLKVKEPLIESLAIPLQQMAYVVVTNGDVTPTDRRFLDGLLPADRWRLAYAPTSVDPLKGDEALSTGYLQSNKKQFVLTYLSLLSRNPGSFVKAYMLETFGYWKPVIGSTLYVPVPLTTKNNLGIYRTDLVDRVTGRSLAPLYDVLTRSTLWRVWLNAGVAVWFAFLSAAVLVLLGKPRYIAALVPCFGSWVGVMLASPIAFTYRYLLMFVICLPLILLLPLIALGAAAEGEPAAPAVASPSAHHGETLESA